MFDWFKKPDYTNVVKFPAPIPLDPPAEKPAMTYYRLGITDNNRVSFSMGYSEITLNKLGVEHMIQQLQVFRDQLTDEVED
jgi:hypothetical protein